MKEDKAINFLKFFILLIKVMSKFSQYNFITNEIFTL